MKDIINTCIKKRDGFNRSLVWSCIACLTLLLIALQGYLAIGYLFASARLGWTVDKFSIYIATSVVVGILGTIFGIKLMQRCAGIVLTFSLKERDNLSRIYIKHFNSRIFRGSSCHNICYIIFLYCLSICFYMAILAYVSVNKYRYV